MTAVCTAPMFNDEPGQTWQQWWDDIHASFPRHLRAAALILFFHDVEHLGLEFIVDSDGYWLARGKPGKVPHPELEAWLRSTGESNWYDALNFLPRVAVDALEDEVLPIIERIYAARRLAAEMEAELPMGVASRATGARL